MKYSDLLKFNNEELFEIAKALESPFNTLEDHISFYQKKQILKLYVLREGRMELYYFIKENGFIIMVIKLK